MASSIDPWLQSEMFNTYAAKVAASLLEQDSNIGRWRGTMLAEEKREQTPGMIKLPAPTAWPMITALGITLLCAGLVTHVAVSVVGLILALRGAVGWFREVLPVEKQILEPVRPQSQQAQAVKLYRRTKIPLSTVDAGRSV